MPCRWKVVCAVVHDAAGMRVHETCVTCVHLYGCPAIKMDALQPCWWRDARIAEKKYCERAETVGGRGTRQDKDKYYTRAKTTEGHTKKVKRQKLLSKGKGHACQIVGSTTPKSGTMVRSGGGGNGGRKEETTPATFSDEKHLKRTGQIYTNFGQKNFSSV